jgi:putative ABC transport system permease protein
MALLSLGLGIGANTLIFGLLNGTLLRQLDYREPQRLVTISTVPKGHPKDLRPVNVSSYLAWKERATSFESMGSFFFFESILGREENGAPAERIEGQYLSASLLPTLGVNPELGRNFTEQESAPVRFAKIILISDRLWERRYGRDPHIAGRTIELDGEKTTIVGVMPRGFTLFDDEMHYWGASGITRERFESGKPLFTVVARLKKGVSIEQAQAEMDAVSARVAQEDPARNGGYGAVVRPLRDSMVATLRGPLLLLQGAVVFLLLIACANVAGLLLARGASRQTEVAVRSAVGAGRWRIVRQLLTESVILAFGGGVLGLALAWCGLRLFIANAPSGFPHLDELGLDVRVHAFTAATAMFTGILFGLVPALQLSRSDVIEALKCSARGSSTTLVRQRFRTSLVTLQIALALMLLIGAGLTINSFLRMEANRLGMDPHGLLVFQFRYPGLQVLKPVGMYRQNGYYKVDPNVDFTLKRILERLRHVPGAVSVAASTSPPIGFPLEVNFKVPGEASAASHDALPSAAYLGVSPSYFTTLKTEILRGRDFSKGDTAASTRVAIVNETMARLYWAGRNPVGRRLSIDFLPGDAPREIVGVVADVRLTRTQQEPRPIIYVPLCQQGPEWVGPQLGARAGAYFVVRTTGDPLSIVPSVQKAVAEIDGSQPVSNISTVEQVLRRQIQYTTLYMVLLGVFGGTAAILAAVGIYGVMSFSIAQRRREIGVRMALGANQRSVLRLVGRQAISMITLGLLLGLVGSVALTRLLESSLWNVKSTDPLTFAAVSLFLGAIAVVACVVPTREATRVDPADAVRAE